VSVLTLFIEQLLIHQKMKEIVNEMYSIDEIANILNINVEAVKYIQQKTNIPHKICMRTKCYNLKDFIPYKFDKILPILQRKYDLTWVQSLDVEDYNTYYGVSEEREVKINIIDFV